LNNNYFFSFLFVSILNFCCNAISDIQIETIIEIKAESSLDKGQLKELKNGIMDRLVSSGFKNNEIINHKNPLKLIIQSSIKSKDKERYNSILVPIEVSLSKLHDYSGSLEEKIDSRNIEVPNFFPIKSDKNRNYFPTEVLGGCYNESYFDNIKSSLQDNLKDIEGIKLVWSKERIGPESSPFLLYMIDSRNKTNFNVTNDEIENVMPGRNQGTPYFATIFELNVKGSKKLLDITTQLYEENSNLGIIVEDRVFSNLTISRPLTQGNFTIIEGLSLEDQTKTIHLSENLMLKSLSHKIEIVSQNVN